MKHKISELEGALLDAAVADAMGVPFWAPGKIDDHAYMLGDETTEPVLWRPSTDWRQGGEIIERERISVQMVATPNWRAFTVDAGGVVRGRSAGPTPLVAAMRAYVASRFGEEVELP